MKKEETKSPDSLPSQIPDKLTSAPKDSLEWEEAFEKKITTYDKDGGFVVFVEGYENTDFDCDLIKSFIKQQIAKAKEEERTRIRGMIEGKKGKYSWAPDYNLALTDILKEIGE